MENCILREDKNGVCTLTLNRPERLNVLESNLFRAMKAELDSIKDDPGIRCVVLRGAGRCFCSGHDVGVFGQPDQDEAFNAAVISELEALPMPVIAAVHGYCYTGALELALGCDIILAAEDAKFADTHAKFGLMPAWGLSARLPERVGRALALEMSASCRTYTGAEAERMGLANHCFPNDVFWDEVAKLAEDIAKNAAPSIARVKALLLKQRDPDALKRERDFDTFKSPDADERLRAFAERKKKQP